MSVKYDRFDIVEQGNDEYIIAQPGTEHDEPVRFRGDIAITGEEGEDATYLEVVENLIRYDLSQSLDLQDGDGGSLERGTAVESLLNLEETPIPIESEQQAEAIVDYFVDRGVLEDDGSEVVVLVDPGDLVEFAKQNLDGEADADVDAKMILNWISAIESCTSKIDETIEEVEEVRAELEEQIGGLNVEEKAREFEEKQQEVAQQLMNLTNGGELDESDLSASERAEYQRLEERLFHLESMIESISGSSELEETVRRMARDCSMRAEMLQDDKDALQTQKNRLSKMYKVGEQIGVQQAQEMAKVLSNVATSIAGVASAEELAEEEDTMEKAASILSGTADVEQRHEAEQAQSGRDQADVEREY